MDDELMFTLLVDLHRDGGRHGPGSDEETLRALELARLDRKAELQVADIGCGTGASTLTLADKLPRARITWLRPNPPDEIRDHRNAEYPEIATASQKITILERGFITTGVGELRDARRSGG